MQLARSELELEVVVQRIERGEIDLQPEFQRGEVWNLQRRKRLIDTILRGWYVPAIHLIRDSEGRDQVLDGQQRLAAIREFFADRLRVDGRTSPPNPHLEELHGLRFSRLPEADRREVRRFPLAVVTLHDYEPDEPYELFFRLNQHLPLTASEKRNALYGVARDQVKDVVRDLVERQLLAKENVGFANGRLAYDDVLARFALAVETMTLRQPFSNARLEDFYRSHTFNAETLRDIAAAAENFLTAAKSVQPRLNKASFFSWLVFAYTMRVHDRGFDRSFLAEFEHLRAAVADDAAGHQVDPRLSALVRVYINRSSYRVNDILSVLLRDAALRMAHGVLGGSADASANGLERVWNATPTDGRSLERRLVELVEADDWDPLR
jgi:hypothetical protein